MMIKAASMKRGSRKKNQLPSQAEQSPSAPPVARANEDRHQQLPSAMGPEQQQQQQQQHRQQAIQQQQQHQQHAYQQRAMQQQQQLQPPSQRAPSGERVMRRPASQRREPIPEQMELTKKNYRLAKELSELRVRHREECKNVTRLTMENMNLASRCREAISHVAMLKKELAHHQKRAQEALRFQREQTQRMASNLSAEVSKLSLSRSMDSESANSSPERIHNKSEMERILASLDPPPPPPPRNVDSTVQPRTATVEVENVLSSNESILKSEIRTVSPQGEFHTDIVSSDEDETVNKPRRNGRSVLDVVENLSNLSSPDHSLPSPEPIPEPPPRVYSTPNRNRKEDRWTPSIDEAPGSVGKKDADGMTMFPRSASPTVGGHARNRNYNEEYPPDIALHQSSSNSRMIADFDKPYPGDEDDEIDGSQYRSASPPPTRLQKFNGMITINSIDAFEASFDTTFPSTFAHNDGSFVRDSNETPKSTEIYNPFEPSPARSIDRSAASTSPSNSKGSPNPEIVRTTNVLDGSLPWTNDSLYSTPPKGGRRPEVNSYGEPIRPHKTPSAEARARYEKALQPRGSNAIDNCEASITTTNAVENGKANTPEHKSGGILGGTPSLFLKRIQQRRKLKDQDRADADVKGTPPPSEEQVDSRQYSPSESSLTQENMAPSEAGPSVQQASPRRHEMQAAREQFSAGQVGAREPPEINGRSGGMVARLSALKSRRSIKQPISYAEPALNTKIRQGHSFFPKIIDSAQPRIVTPEQMTHPL